MAKLTDAQFNMLLSCEEDGATAASHYAPVVKLLGMGLIEERPTKYGSRYYLTATGRLALEEARNG